MTLFGHVFSPSFLALLVIWVAGRALALTLKIKRLRGRQSRSGPRHRHRVVHVSSASVL